MASVASPSTARSSDWERAKRKRIAWTEGNGNGCGILNGTEKYSAVSGCAPSAKKVSFGSDQE
jgi:hypothetical protein